MSSLSVYVIDTETTGLNAKTQEMTEIGIIRCVDKVQLCRNIKCETPETASLDALRITNKTMADLLQGHSKEDVVNECDKFFSEDGLTPGHRVIVCHNISFDRRFLHALWEKCGKQFPSNMWLCTMAMMKDYIKKQGINSKVNLDASCEALGIKKFAGAHNAKVDSRNTYLLHKILVEDKKMDYLAHIKSVPHFVGPQEERGLNPDDLDD